MIAVFLQAIALSVCCIASGRRLLHVLQLESYQLPGYLKSIRRNPKRTWLPCVWTAVAGVLPLCLGAPYWVCLLLQTAVAAFCYAKVRAEKAKKPLVLTERVKRLVCVHFAVGFVCAGALSAIWAPMAYLLPLFEPVLLALCTLCAQPMEKRIANRFMEDARRRLDAVPGLVRIGITGSYGKTSTKFLLRDILSVKYRVLATPSSFNTPMGVTRVIREQLTPGYQVFIAEMGARHVGDIRELVDLVHPTMGMITSIGPQHLDTFGTIERIRDTKYELIEGLPANGIALFARDGALCEELYARCPLEKKAMPGDLIRSGDVRVGPQGTRFTLTDTATGETVLCQTELLGEHAIANLLLCCTAARLLGMTLPEIAIGVSHCKAVEHRLQLLQTRGGITVIDDAFNSNPVGAAAALRVLKEFPGRRIIVTPGMVELGKDEAAYNRAFGEQMAECVNIAVLIGKKHVKPIAEGLLAAGFAQDCLHIVADLEESTRLLNGMMRTGDVVLYENDLPDNYSE